VIYYKGGYQLLLGFILYFIHIANHNGVDRLQKFDERHLFLTFNYILSVIIVNSSELTIPGVYVKSFAEDFSIQAVLDDVVGRQAVPQTIPLGDL
jgi:hypothetical protein